METPLFEDVIFKINSREANKSSDHIGLIGKNGSGKTTLINIILGNIKPDEGKIIYSKSDIRFSLLEQGNEFTDSDNTIFDEALSTIPEILILEKKLDELETRMETAHNDELISEYGNIQEEYLKLDGYSYNSKVEKVLSQFEFNEEMLKRYVKTLSGGEKTRLKLAKLLITEPDLLILDEPTNHLDINTIQWLEDFLKSYKGAYIVISHDREFLNNVCNKIWDIRESKLIQYKGNYEDYEEQRAIEEETQLKAYEKQQKKIKTLEKELRRRTVWSFRKEKEKIGAYDKGRVGHQAAKLMKKAMVAKKNIERLLEKEKVEEPNVEKKIKLTFDFDKESSPTVLNVNNISKSFNNKELLSDINLRIEKNDKLVVMGENGSGKTTFLKLIAGRIEADSGEIIMGNNTKIGYYSQELEDLNFNNTVLDELLEVNNNQTDIRTRLGVLGIDKENVYKKIDSLSYGEKGKVLLTKLLISDCNFLVLDEPTNHLDIKSKIALQNALLDYNGAFILVTHDRYLAKTVSDKIFYIDKNKIISDL